MFRMRLGCIGFECGGKEERRGEERRGEERRGDIVLFSSIQILYSCNRWQGLYFVVRHFGDASWVVGFLAVHIDR